MAQQADILNILGNTLANQAWVLAPLTGFAAGLVSSLLPCSVGVLPLLVGYIGGASPTASTDRSFYLRSTLLFVIGLAILLTGLGLASVALGRSMGAWLTHNGLLLLGILTLLMGAQTLGWLHLPLPGAFKRLPELGWARWAEPLLLGMAYGLLASPCGTPFLVVILGFVSQSKSWVLGGLTLFAYALGQSVLLFLAGMVAGVLKSRATLAHWGDRLGKISGALLLLMGLYLLTTGLAQLLPNADKIG